MSLYLFHGRVTVLARSSGHPAARLREREKRPFYTYRLRRPSFFFCRFRPSIAVAEGKMKHAIQRFMADESGATAIEYGLLASLIAVVIIGAVKVVGTNLSTKFTAVANNLS